MHQSEQWKAALEQFGWADAFMPGDEFVAFIKEESDRMAGVLKDVGLVQ